MGYIRALECDHCLANSYRTFLFSSPTTKRLDLKNAVCFDLKQRIHAKLPPGFLCVCVTVHMWGIQ
jgi:hypothetical protein